MEYKTDGSSQIILLRDYLIPQSFNIRLWIFIVAIAAAIALSILVYTVFMRKQMESDEEIYHAIR